MKIIKSLTSYNNPLYYEEMMRFYEFASSSEIQQMDEALENDNWDKAFNLLKKITFKKSSSLKSKLTSDEMIDFILDNKLRDWSGKLDYESAKEIAGASSTWILTDIPLDSFDWAIEPKRRKSNLPPIVLDLGDEYEVLDGKHRIAEARYRGENQIQVYLGKF